MSKRIRYCGIPACPNNRGTTNSAVPFFTLPIETKKILHKKWIDAMKVLYGVEFRTGKLCGLHFQPNDYQKSDDDNYILKPAAIPSVPIDELPLEFYKESSFKFVDIETIKRKADTVQLTHPLISDVKMEICDNDNDTECDANVCHQCNEWERKYMEMQERCEELYRENSKLKAQLLNRSDNNIDTATETIEDTLSDTNIIVKDEMNISTEEPVVNDESPLDTINDCVDSEASSTKVEKTKPLKKTRTKTGTRSRTKAINAKNYYYQNDKQFECYICKIEISSLWRMKGHLKKHVAARNKRCLVCDEYLTLKEDIDHMCYGEKTISCEYCGVVSSSTSELLNHLETHEDRTMRKCLKCPRLFGMSQLIEWHDKLHEIEQPRPYICSICSAGFRSKSVLYCHLQTHNTVDFLCSICGKGCKDKSALRSHSYTHQEKRFKCPDCPFTCRKNSQLNYHRDAHMNVTYKCPKCDAQFTTRRGLQKHASLRHRVLEKKHHCTFCPQKFHDADKLVTHLRKHTGEKPFVCEICPNKKFSYKGDHTKHMRIHFGENLYKCNLCDESFRTNWQLNRHSFVHYKKDDDNAKIDS